jgi:F-type H+-transporting ATPase subunit alpha
MTKAMKAVTGSLKIELAQYRALEAFALFASDLDAASKQQLARGQRLMELFKQPQYSPYATEEQVVSIWLGTTGQLDHVDVGDVRRFEQEFLDHLRRNTDVLTTIAETLKFGDDTAASLEKEAESFRQYFQSGSDEGLVAAGDEDYEATGDEDIAQEQIVRQKQ